MGGSLGRLAVAAFESWGRTTPAERSNLLLRIADAIEDSRTGAVVKPVLVWPPA